jgi:chromatin remodeling complex protein RSC6
MAPKKTSTVAAPVPASTPNVAAASKEAAAAVVNPPAVAAAPPPAAVDEDNVDRFATILTKLQSWQADIKEAILTVKALQKEHNKLKTQKGGRKGRKNSGANAAGGEKRNPSGFAKPTNLSDELCDFLGIARGSSLARTEVTRIINQYVKDNKLQNAEDRRMIVPDAKLKTIVTLGKDDKLTYFNLQSFIKRHFKTAATATATPAPAAV